MFGKNKKVEKLNESIHYNFPVPPRKEFVTIRNLVDDIENYDKFSEFEVRNNSIDSLIKYLEKYKLLERKSITFSDLENKDKFE
jgi:hypothetical protein